MIDFLKKVWNSPNTLVGVLTMSLMGGTKKFKRRKDGHYESEVGTVFDTLMRKNHLAAITLGERVLYVAGAYNKERALHEEAHIEQGRKFGPLFFPAYGLKSIISKVKYKNWYKDNNFEKQARKAEKSDNTNV